MDQQHYVGHDVSLEATSICVVDPTGAIIWRGRCSPEPEAFSRTLRTHASAAVRTALETGQMPNWLTLQRRKRGLPVVCLDARHAKGALSMQLNTMDANDANRLNNETWRMASRPRTSPGFGGQATNSIAKATAYDDG